MATPLASLEMTKKSHTFTWPKFDVRHNEIFIDVYRNDLFDERILKNKDCNSIKINCTSEEESLYLQIFPSNGGSIYNKDYHKTKKKSFLRKINSKLNKNIEIISIPPEVVSSRVYLSNDENGDKIITAHCSISGICDRIQYSISRGKKISSPFYIDFTNKPNQFSFSCPKNKSGYLSFIPYYKDIIGKPYTHHQKI